MQLPEGIKRILNFPNDVVLLLYKEDKENLDLLTFLISINFGCIVYFWFCRDPLRFPPSLWECLAALLAAKFGNSITSAFRQTGGLTVNRHIYNSTSQTVPSVIQTTNSSPGPNVPAKTQVTPNAKGKSLHPEGNPEEEV